MTGIIFYIPEDLAITPIDGECITNSYWTVHPELGVAFYTTRKRPYGMEPYDQDAPSPQCNKNEYTAKHIQETIYPDCTTKLIPVVFMGHAIKEMHKQRKLVKEAS